MRIVDDDLLAGVARGSEQHVLTIEVSRERPHFDLELISNPHVDAPAADGDEGAPPRFDGLARAFVERYEKLRAPFSDAPPDLAIVRGEPIVQPPRGAPDVAREDAWAQIWRPALAGLAERAKATLWVRGGDSAPAAKQAETESDRSPTAPVDAQESAAIFAVRASGEEERGPLAHVVVLGWGGQLASGEGLPASRSQQLIAVLASSTSLNTPLHLVCVTPADELPDPVFRECERLRVSLLLTGAAEGTGVISLSRAGPRRGQGTSDLVVVRCPSFQRGVVSSGMARVRLDVWKGDAEVALVRDLGADLAAPPIQVVSPLLSASRVPNSERRLYSRVGELLEAGLEKADDEPAEAAIRRFGREAARMWSSDGYVKLCDDDGLVPLPETRHTRYHLLLLVRERDGRYQLLLGNHSPLRPSLLCDWNTLLLPAFKDARALLEHLRDDVVRQVRERAEDFERAAHARAFEQAVERILSDDGAHGDDFWAEEIREVASRKIRKISPTTGAVTECEYSLVTLLPLVDRNTAKPVEDGADRSREAERRRDRHRIVQWLDGLDTVVGSGTAERGLSLEALQADGCAVRWDPRVGLLDEPRREDRRRAERAAPGAIWFPLSSDGEEPLWRQCPSIVSRNADVMSWVEGVLDKKDVEGEGLPSELLLGSYGGASASYRFEGEIFPFEGRTRAADPEVAGISTVDALGKVRFAEDSDLDDESDPARKLPYDGAAFERVFLVSQEFELAGFSRRRIVLFPAEPGESFSDEVVSRRPLGALRPVQRYVLKAGLERAKEINEKVRPRLGEEGDEWGFARVRKGGAPQAVSVTPPIVEQLHPIDWDDAGESDFIVCDGNHRIVQSVWRERQPIAAVAVTGKLLQPYYARPFGRLEWDATADNELVVTPELASKYLARKVDRESLPADAKRKLKAVPDSDLYRRYYRDLTKGFGYMGGQGGRYV